MDLSRLRGLTRVSSQMSRVFQRWLEKEGVFRANNAQSEFELRSDIEAVDFELAGDGVGLFSQFMPFFDIGIYLERPSEANGLSQGKEAKVLAAFAKGKIAQGDVLGFPVLDLRLPEHRLVVQRAKPSGGLIEAMGLSRIRVWKEPYLIYVPVNAATLFLFVCDRPDPFQRMMADQALKKVVQATQKI
jgi:hypothetical protein